MITVRFKKAETGSMLGFRATGHAGWAESGDDIVCAAVSATVWQTANGLETFAKARVRKDKYGVCCMVSSPTEASNVLLESFFACLTEMEKQYSDYLCVKIAERKDGM